MFTRKAEQKAVTALLTRKDNVPLRVNCALVNDYRIIENLAPIVLENFNTRFFFKKECH